MKEWMVVLGLFSSACWIGGGIPDGGSSAGGGSASATGGGTNAAGGGTNAAGGGTNAAGGGSSATGGGSSATTGGGSSAAGGGSSATGGGSTETDAGWTETDAGSTGGGFAGGLSGTGGGFAGGLSGPTGGGFEVSPGSCRNLARFPDPEIQDLAIESPGVLSVRMAEYNAGWQDMNHQVDVTTGAVTSINESWCYQGCARGSRATNGHGLSLVLGGWFSNTQQAALYSHHSSMVLPMPATADWTVHEVVYNPNRNEFALFWFGSDTPHYVPTNNIMMQTRFADAGVGFTRDLAPQDYLGKPDAVSWAPGRYFILGTAGVHIVSEDGTHQTSVPFQGLPRSIASNRATQAGAAVHGTDGGALLFAQVDAVTGSATETVIQAPIVDSSARVVWDPVLRQWHVAYSTLPNDLVSLASFSEAGAMVGNAVLGCRVEGRVTEALLDGRSLYIGFSSFPATGQWSSGVLRYDL